MAYTSVTKIRYSAGLDSLHPSDTVITQFITEADKEIDSILEVAGKFSEKIFYRGEGRFIDLSLPFSSIREVWKDSNRLLEYDETNLLDDGNTDIADSTDVAPEYWNETEASGDTLSWATDYSFTLYRSLKINKGGSSESSWYSDNVEEVSYLNEYKAIGRIKVDSSASAAVYLRLTFYDSDDAVIVNYDSAAVTIQITHPTSSSALAIVSSSTSDTTQKVIIEGTSGGVDTSETVSLNGTTSVNSTNSYTYIRGLRLDKTPAGTITLTSNSGAVTNATLTSTAMTKRDWQEISVIGSAPYHSQYARVILRCTSSTGNCWGDSFRLFERNWKPLPSDQRVEFYDSIAKDSIMRMIYIRTYSHDLLEELSTLISSMKSFVWLSGGDTESDYEMLKLGGMAPAAISNKFKFFKERIDMLKQQILSHDFHNPDFIIGTFK